MLLEQLKRFPDGEKPKPIATQLEDGGFKAPGKSTVAILVGTELWKMEKAKLIEKKPGGIYKLIAEPPKDEMKE